MKPTIRLVNVRRNQRGEATWYQYEVSHSGLNEVRSVGDRDADVASSKASALASKWEDKWAKAEAETTKVRLAEGLKDEADVRTATAEANLHSLGTILVDGVHSAGPLDFSALERNETFQFANQDKYLLVAWEEGGRPTRIKHVHSPTMPDSRDPSFTPQLTFVNRILPFTGKRKVQDASARLAHAQQAWRTEDRAAQTVRDRAEIQLVEAQADFDAQHADYVSKLEAHNKKVAALKTLYSKKNAKAIIRYNKLVLQRSDYPDFLAIDFDVSFKAENGVLVVECELPDEDALPTLQKVTFVKSSNEMREKHITESSRDRLYDSLLYQVALRTISELTLADLIDAIQLIVFNGWVNALNPATGQRARACLLSVQTRKQDFSAIDLMKVDPKACFRQLKGVSAAKLSGMSPVRPILQLQTEDPRFVASHAVAEHIEEGFNLATMDWEEFEHLVRELFEKEFATGDAQVRVTRASADGGVDAVVLDPDPLRGGKIVIQAKRYTNTVGLSAVRDLYGTVINEGANRGILVSTADYGPDSYEFVKGKPLTLLSGSNLLSLLEKHGHRARIDLREAKAVNALAR